MATEVRMPKLGMSMKKGVVAKWRRAEGDDVKEGEEIADISTEKIEAKLTAPASGVLGRILVAEKVQVPVGAVLAYVGAPGEAFPEAPPPGAAPPAAAHGASSAAPAPAPAPPGGAAAPPAEVPASPAARRMASELGIDISRVPPSAPGKRVTTEDVEAYAAALAAGEVTATPGRVIPFEGIRRVVAERMTESLLTMAQVTVTREVDGSSLVARRSALLAGFEAATGLRLTYTDLIIETVARLLPDHPLLNATLTDDGVVLLDDIHIGFAVALENGLIVAVIRDAATSGGDGSLRALSLGEIVSERVRLADRAEAGTLDLDDVTGSTFTITNLGAFGTDAFTPIVNPPEVAILGVGRLAERPWVVDGALQVRPTMWLSLTFDHRIVDGAPAARFLEALADALEAPV